MILLPMQGETDVIYDASLHVQGDKIVYAGPKALAPAAQDGDEVINGGGRIAMPGFVNTHAHNAMVLFRGAADDCRCKGGSMKRFFLWRINWTTMPPIGETFSALRR